MGTFFLFVMAEFAEQYITLMRGLITKQIYYNSMQITVN